MPGARREYYGRALPVWPPNDASATGHGPDNDEAPPDLNEFWVTWVALGLGIGYVDFGYI